jgi:hypothetical protein
VNAKLAEIVRDAKLVPMLPPYSREWDAEPIPEGIVGAKILGFGSVHRDQLPDNACSTSNVGLVIDYLPGGDSQARRAVLGFTELGMWIEEVLVLPSY